MNETTPPLPPSPEISPWKAAFSSRSFLLAVGLLVVAAVGLNTAARALEMYFKKLPVPLRHRLDDAEAGLPKELGPWVMVQQTSSLNEDVQHTLGTREFVFRTYVNSTVAGRDIVDELVKLGQEAEALDESNEAEARAKKLKQSEWSAALRKVQIVNPQAVVSLNVTFYTGMVDTVAHVPDRCMVADGFEPKDPKTVEVVAGRYADERPREIRMQYATFEDQTGHGRVGRNVAYFFHCNGTYVPNAVDVRGKLQNLFEKYGYYAKVEMMTDDPGRPASREKNDESKKSIDSMADLLSFALPEVERCLPDWEAATGAKPAAPAAGSAAVAAK